MSILKLLLFAQVTFLGNVQPKGAVKALAASSAITEQTPDSTWQATYTTEFGVTNPYDQTNPPAAGEGFLIWTPAKSTL